MSCLSGLDEDDKEAEMNALTLLQEPVRMAQGPVSYMDSFGKPTPFKQNNSVHDVMSNNDTLSPGGLGNGPSSLRATQAIDSLSAEKDEEKSITPLKTVQEIDTAGIWGFDIESPENSLDDFTSPSNLHWDPHKEFMQFLWDNHDESPGEEPQKEAPPPITQRRRKRKMDMVVMVDPSEELCPDLSYKSSEDSTDGEDPTYTIPTSKAPKLRTHSKSNSSSTVSKYPNGTAKAIKQILYNAPNENSIDRLSPVKGRLSIKPHSDEKLSCYPCSKCNLIFKQEHQLQRHMKSHADLSYMSPKPFICRECGQSFKVSGSLVDHMSVHQENKERIVEEIKDTATADKKDLLHCPQCPFRTKSPDSFVSHAKTHEKSKRYFDCEKCSYKAASQNDLVKHDILRHTGFPASKAKCDDSGIFSCRICSYRVFSINVFKNHLQRRHQQTYEEYNATQESDTKGQSVEKQLISPNIIKRQDSSTKPSSPIKSNDISDLFKHDKSVNKCLKSQLAESKLDKSINVLLSRQRHEKATEKQEKIHNKSAQDSNGNKSENSQVPRKITPMVEETNSLSDGHSQPPVAKLDPDSRCDSSATENERNSTSKPALDRPVMKKSPSKRKMSTPYRNTNEQDSCFILPKHLPSPKRLNLSESEDPDEKDSFQFNDKDANTNLCNNGIKEENTLMYTCSRRMSIRGALQASKELFNKIKTEPNGQNEPIIKEEDIETEVFTENLESRPMSLEQPLEVDWSTIGSDCRSCPYCPEVFDSGVGLSNHVRGHLHRVGLSYNARHVVPPEQVASKDKRPRIRRKMSAIRQLKKAFQLESSTEVLKGSYSCPLCGDSFDNKTGQSNHIRGHLKRLGKHISTKSKSPLCLLRELMRDKKEYHRALQILGKKRDPFQFSPSSKLANIDGFTPPSVGLPKKNLVQTFYNNAKPLSKVSLVEMASDKKQLETKLEVKGSLSSASALIGILKKRKCQEDSKLKSPLHMSRNPIAVSSMSEHSTSTRVASTLPNSVSEKGEFNRKVCIHCNATFHSGVSLSNHLRAYAKRKRTALIEGTTYDCKARRHRSRPGSKKKTLAVPHTPEEMYRLTCRFCDLVFQGPLSVQEDWIKHLQRHIMNTSVPHTGLSMVEVTLPPRDPLAHKADQDISQTATHSASGY